MNKTTIKDYITCRLYGYTIDQSIEKTNPTKKELDIWERVSNECLLYRQWNGSISWDTCRNILDIYMNSYKN